jgi:uncharacterized protein DUF5615
VKFKLDENLPVSAAAPLAGWGHDVDTVAAEGLTGAADLRVWSLRLPGSAGFWSRWTVAWVTSVLTRRAPMLGSWCCAWPASRPPAVRQAVTELANWVGLDELAGPVAVLQQGVLRIRRG